jgi:DnaJ-class molecular chaperone
MPGRDHYVVLGVARDETTDGIRAAYRRLVARHVRAGARTSDAVRGREIADAYGILSDPAVRERYDGGLAGLPAPALARKRRWPEAGPSPLFAEPLSAPARFHSIHPSIEELRMRLRRAAMGIGSPKGGHVDRLHVEVLLSRDEAARGGAFDVGVPVPRWCARCGGAGEEGYRPCPACGGDGVVEHEALVRARVPRGGLDATLEFLLRDVGLDDIALEVHVRIAPWGALG